VKRAQGLALAIVLIFVSAACGRSGGAGTEAASQTGSSSSVAAGAADPTALAQGGFGDISKVCSPGDGAAKTASDKGVSATEIHVGTVTDKGFTGRNGLNKEMFDAAVAFAAFCNDHGGILGRKLVIDDRDAKLTDYNAVVLQSCEEDLALVGGGAVFDDGDNNARVDCGLPSIAGFVVSPKARVATLQVQPLPNPVYTFPSGPLAAANSIAPGSLTASAVLTAGLPSTIVVRDATVEAIELIGGKVVDKPEYSALGEANWSPFVLELKQAGVKFMHMVGEPENLALLQKAMKTDGYYPDVIIETANHYDKKLTDNGGDAIKNTWVQMVFTPFELASENKATKDYLDLMKQYNAGGKVALLGAQTMSSFLLFAKAATDCGVNLTRTCLLEKAKTVTTWTGAGLHAETNPGGNVGSPCFLFVKASAAGFEYDATATKPTKGRFNCDPKNLIELKNDYGVPR
jgi:ABC-type branched-subunit amino acid transport system substrate-binding protein